MARIDPDPALRVLPHNLEAEKSVLGSILISNSAFERAAAIVKPEDFFRRGHRAIFEAMVTLIDRERAGADMITLKAELERRGDLDEAGGAAYLAAMADGIARSSNVEHYARLVKDASERRAIIRIANGMLDAAYLAELPAADLITEADRAVIDLQRGALAGRMISLRDSAGLLFQDVANRVEHPGVTGLATGFASIDDLTFGWQAADLIVIAARPSIGKTAFVLNTAVHAAQAGKRAAIFSLEMRRRQLELRILSHLSGVMLTRILGGFLTETDFEKLSPALARMHDLGISIDDRGRQTVGDIRRGCRRLKAEAGLDLVVVDYVQLITGTLERRGASRNEEVTDISRRLKELSDEIAAPILLLSQLNRGADARHASDKRPQLSDLRESGALEQDADLVCFLHRRHHRESGTTNFIIDKQRNGPTGTVNVTLNRETQTFTDGGEDAPAEAPGTPRPQKPARLWETG